MMHGDCLEMMRLIPDGSVDMVLTDPPYGTVAGIARSRAVVRDVQFAHAALLKYARTGKKFDPFWWS